MGIIKELKRYKKVKEFESLVEEVFGYSVKEIKEKLSSKTIEVPKNTEETKKINEEKSKEKFSPEDFVKMFAGQVEEFYPNGDAPRHN